MRDRSILNKRRVHCGLVNIIFSISFNWLETYINIKPQQLSNFQTNRLQNNLFIFLFSPFAYIAVGNSVGNYLALITSNGKVFALGSQQTRCAKIANYNYLSTGVIASFGVVGGQTILAGQSIDSGVANQAVLLKKIQCSPSMRL